MPERHGARLENSPLLLHADLGLEITKDHHAAATAFVKLQNENLWRARPTILSKLRQLSIGA